MPRSSPKTSLRVQVLAPYPLARAYDYAVPEGMTLAAGDYVRVPLGRKETIGVVWHETGDETLPAEKLKPVLEKYDVPAMPKVHRKFIDWVSRYTMAEAGAVLKMSLSAKDAIEPPKRKRKDDTAPCALSQVPKNTLTLSTQQITAAETLTIMVKAQKYGCALLDGVTGSGKTEVYFEAVAAALAQGKQALILLPEISLTAQFLERFERRFGIQPALWHSEVTPAQRRRAWQGVVSNQTRVVVGARSALFLPFADLGLIVVDEEHEASYKQEDGVTYHARDMAIARAHLGGFAVALVSATPSLETMTNAKAEKYSYLHLPSRHAGAEMPAMQVIDLRANAPPRGKFISPALQEALAATLAAGEQSLLFLNRRGYAPLTLCRSCGYRFQCPSCSAWLVEHRRQAVLQCHHCGHRQKPPKACPQCAEEGMLAACGPGVERIEEEVKALFPDARALVLASDESGGQKAVAEAVKRIEDKDVDIIIGTQIIAKGHHFPSLTCVGVIDADLGLSGGDLRAGERTFQLLQQVSGRAGRAEKKGRVFIQTYMPVQNVIQALAANNRDKFLEAEAQARQRAGMPPYGRLAALILSGANETVLTRFCQTLAQKAPRYDDVRVLGPAPAPISFLRGQYRQRFLIKSSRDVALQKFMREWLEGAKTPSSLQMKIDIDPQSFY